MKSIIAALLILFSLILIDIATTVIGFSHGASDLNPFYYAQGFQNFLITKLSVSLSAIPIYIVVYRYFKAKFPKYVKVIWTLLAFMIGFYTFIVINNLIVLSQLT